MLPLGHLGWLGTAGTSRRAGAPDLFRVPYRYQCLSPVALIISASSREPRLACLSIDHAGAETGAIIPPPDGTGAYAIHLKKVGWDG